MNMIQTASELTRATVQRDRAQQNFRDGLIAAFEAGVSQKEIAGIVGVTQPAISQMIAAERQRRRMHGGPVGARVAERKLELLRISHAHGARNIRVFGSVAEGRDSTSSDLDLLVTMPRTVGMLGVSELGDELAASLGAPVDVIVEHMVKPDQLAALKRRAVRL